MTFLDIGDEDFIVCESVIRVKKIDKKTCQLFFEGQSALEGSVVEWNAKKLVQEIIDAMTEEEEEDDQEEDE
jgi:hypothetical protein